MPRYDRNFDYGLRGYRETTAFRGRGGTRAGGYGRDYARGQFGREPSLPNRVTARYNADYVYGNQGDRYPRNYNTFGGDREERVGDFRSYRQPYVTIGGSRTNRGTLAPFAYDTDFYTYDRDFQERW